MIRGVRNIDVLFMTEYSSPYHEHADQFRVSVVTPVSIACLVSVGNANIKI